jgi:lysylphosphatidylglycerol synthetase-like protein (DUF2156 family)
VAAAVASTGRQVGVTLGVAVMGSLAAGGVVAIGPGFPAATHASWWIMAGLGAVTLVLAFVTTSAWGLATAGRVADEFRDIDGPADGSDVARRDDSARVLAG